MAFSNLLRLPPVDLAGQVAPTARVALRTGVPALLLMILVGGVSAYCDLPVNVFLRDTTALGHIPPYYGAISNLGVLGWCAAAAICFFTGFRAASPARSFLLGAAALSALLCLDDLFLLHEEVLLKGLGIPQKLTYSVYMVSLAVHLIRFRAYVLAGVWGPLVLALGALGSAVAIDVLLSHRGIESLNLYEDGAKLTGISLWLGYFWNECRRALAVGVSGTTSERH